MHGATRLEAANLVATWNLEAKLLRFVSDDIWGSRGRCRVISRSIAEYLVHAYICA
jgi:hypothetical protein